jgi:protein involved in polysaccharide export with SLBB domain
LLALLITLSLGCATSPSGGITLFPEGHRMVESAKSLRDANRDGPAPVPRELAKHVSDPWVVEPGDGVLIHPANIDSPVRLPGDQVVLPDGTISLGAYGQILVAGKTIPQIEAEANHIIVGCVKDAGKMVARLVTRDSKVYYVLGEVNSPGSFALRGRETVLDAILAAGGLTANASRNNIILTRPTPPESCRIVLPVCYTDIVQVGDTATNYQIHAGDRVYVPSRTTYESLCPSKASCSRCSGVQTACPLTTHAPELPLPPDVKPIPPHSSEPVWRPAELPKPDPLRDGAEKAAPENKDPDRDGKSENRPKAETLLPPVPRS